MNDNHETVVADEFVLFPRCRRRLFNSPDTSVADACIVLAGFARTVPTTTVRAVIERRDGENNKNRNAQPAM